MFKLIATITCRISQSIDSVPIIHTKQQQHKKSAMVVGSETSVKAKNSRRESFFYVLKNELKKKVHGKTL